MEEASLFSRGTFERRRFFRVGDLVEGFETPFGLELLSTVHWVASQEKANSIEDVIAAVYGWGERKQQFSKANWAGFLGAPIQGLVTGEEHELRR